MDGIRVGHEGQVRSGVRDFFFEGGHFSSRDVWVIGPVEDEDLGFDALFFGGHAIGSTETTVEGDDAGKRGSGAGDFQDTGAAKAVADGGDIFLSEAGEFFELGESGGEALAVELPVAFIFAGKFSGGGQDGADAFAVDIESEGLIAEVGEHAGAHLFVFTKAGPLVDDEDGFAGGFHSGIVSVESFERGVAIGVVDDFFLNLCGE